MIYQPVVSIVVPVLNTKLYLKQCLDSLFFQTLQDIEVICIDNGSTDGSYEFLMNYAQSHENITVMRHVEGRQGEARNVGLELAKGDYIGFVDSDDFVSPDMFQKMVDAAQTGCADVVICNIKLYFEENGYDGQSLPDDLLKIKEPFCIQQRPKLLRNLTICNKLFSRELIEKHKIRFPEKFFHEDQFFVIAALISAQRLATVPDPLYFYRRGRPGSVNEYRGADSLHVFPVMQLVSDFIKDEGVDESTKLLIDEVKVLKFLQIYRLTGKLFQEEYFNQMKKEFQSIKLQPAPQTLSPSEKREFHIVRQYGNMTYHQFLHLRSIYGRLRQCGGDLGLFNWVKRPSRLKGKA